jgi:hypothetical protein
MTQQIKTVSVDGVDYAVVGYFQYYEDSDPAWCEVIDPQGFIVGNFSEVPSDGEVEKCVLAGKVSLTGDGIG